MTRPTLSALIMFSTLAVSSADESQPPTKLVDFFEPGTKLAVRAPKESEYIDLTIITSDEYFNIAKDSVKLELDDLAAKYASVERIVKQKRTELTAQMDQTRPSLRQGWVFKEPTIQVQRPAGDLGTVEHVGNDYIVVSFGEEKRNRRLYATRYIRTIKWHDDELKVFGSVGSFDKRYFDKRYNERQKTEP